MNDNIDVTDILADIRSKIKELSDNNNITGRGINRKIINLSISLSGIIRQYIKDNTDDDRLDNYNKFNVKILDILYKLQPLFNNNINSLLYLIKKIQIRLLQFMWYIANWLFLINVDNYKNNVVSWYVIIKKINFAYEEIRKLNDNYIRSKIKVILLECERILNEINHDIHMTFVIDVYELSNKINTIITKFDNLIVKIQTQPLQITFDSSNDIDVEETTQNIIGSIKLFIGLLEKLNMNIENIDDVTRMLELSGLLSSILELIKKTDNEIDYTSFTTELNNEYIRMYNFLNDNAELLLLGEFTGDIYQRNTTIGGMVTYKNKRKSRRSSKTIRRKNKTNNTI